VTETGSVAVDFSSGFAKIPGIQFHPSAAIRPMPGRGCTDRLDSAALNRAKGAGVGARLDAGAIVDEVVVSGMRVQVRYERCPAGWQAAFDLRHPDVDGLAVTHRLVAESLGDAKTVVPAAIAFLIGRPVDDPH
jgi:hypothetical protein